MARTMSAPVQHSVATEGGVATITFNRPQAYNALTADLIESLIETLGSLERDEAVRAIVITGEGKGFCAGQALDDPRVMNAEVATDIAATVERRYNPLILKLLTMEKPIVAAVNGVAAGAGMGIAGARDFRIVADTASFTTAFVKIGLVPDSGTSLTLPRIGRLAKELELCIPSGNFVVGRAFGLGWCTKVVPAERCLV